jgi:tetraacyldisaccharide 4'-kinase
VVTKCPDDIKDEQMMIIEGKIRAYASCPVFFTRIRYGYPVAINSSTTLPEKVILLSGVANGSAFERYASQHFEVVRHFRFSDHHAYSVSNLTGVCRLAKSEKAAILTTEKDATKLNSDAFKMIFSGIAVFYLPIETEFVKNGKDFDEMLLNVIKKNDLLNPEI